MEQGQKPLSVVITAGQQGDNPQFQVVLGRIRVPGWPEAANDQGRVLADKAYSSAPTALLRHAVRCRRPGQGEPDPPPRPRPGAAEGGRHRLRAGEFPRPATPSIISRLNRNRAVATRYDKLAVRYEATVCIAAINEWLLPHF